MNKINLYGLASSSVIDYTNGDVTSSVLKEYAIKHMYSVISCLSSLNILGQNTKLMALPDFTFSRNDYRFKDGVPIGTIIHIDSKTTPFIPMGFRPNCCSVVLVKTKNIISIEKLMEKIDLCAKQNLDVYVNNFKKGNHFIGLYYDQESNEYYGLIHGSLHMSKEGRNDVPGLYLDKSTYWNDKLKIYKEGNINLSYLINEDAVEYYNVYNSHEKYTKEQLRKFASYIFETNDIDFIETHEGMFGINTLINGAYLSHEPFNCPILLNAQSDLTIVNINKPLKIGNELLYACPHGGGYDLLHLASGKFDRETNLFELIFNNNAKMITDDVRKLIYDYRSDSADIWTKKHEFGSIYKKLKTLFNVKL